MGIPVQLLLREKALLLFFSEGLSAKSGTFFTIQCSLVVSSLFSERAQHYKNLKVNSNIEVKIGAGINYQHYTTT